MQSLPYNKASSYIPAAKVRSSVPRILYVEYFGQYLARVAVSNVELSSSNAPTDDGGKAAVCR